MPYFRKFLVVGFLLLNYFEGHTQVFGGNPASQKWRQVNTPFSRVIFPAGLDSTALKITGIISGINHSTQKTNGHQTKKINIVLQNQTTVSNGYVGLGPFRSEFFMTPPQNSFDLGSIPWYEQLSIHEYRHVQQYNSFNVGAAKLLRSIFGEEGQAIANNAAIPNWLFEGGAVFNESDLSKQGRGRLPHFFNGYRSLWQAGKNYSWQKLRNGSLKDFVPDHYPLGYMMVAYGHQKYGDQFWEQVTQDAAAFKPLFYPLQHAIKKYSGKDYVTFRNEAFHFFKQQFNLEAASNLNAKKTEVYTDEEYPSFDDDGNLILVKSSYKKTPEFILRKNGRDRKIRAQDYTLDSYFSYRSGKIVYATYRPNIRWGYSDYSDLRIIDVNSGHQKTLTSRTKYFSPDISDDGQKIVAVNEPSSGTYNLHLLNANNGQLIFSIPNPDKLFYSFPKFLDSNRIVSAVRNNEGRISIAIIPASNQPATYLLPFTYNVIGFPLIHNDTLYFSCSYLKNDELFAYTFSDKKIWLLQTEHQNGFGKYHAAVNDSGITWSSFTASGYRIQTAGKNELSFVEIPAEHLQNGTSNFGISALDSGHTNVLNSLADNSLTITKYPKSYRLFNFHSIEPAANDPQYSLSLIGENILNTLQSNVTFTYDRSEKFKQVGFGATFGGWFPYLSGGINYTFDRKILYHGHPANFNQLQPYAGISVPLNFSKGRTFTFLNVGSQYVCTQNDFKGKYKDSLRSGDFSYSNNFISFSNQLQKARQEIFPRFAQSFSASYKTPFSISNSSQFVISGNIYFPGFFRTHSLLLNLAYLGKDSSTISFSSGFPFSRGYQSQNLYRMYKLGANYQLPLFYPDKGFGNIIYFLRIRSNIFYDETRTQDFYTGSNHTFKTNFRSTGAEIYFDTKWWNQANISFGMRYSYLLDRDIFGGSGNNRWEIILPVNIFNQ